MTRSGINPTKTLRNRRGAMLVFVAVSMVGLLGMLVLTLDVGNGNWGRRIAQTAADGGAVDGAMEIYRHSDDATVEAAALNGAQRNGVIPSATVNYPPLTGPYANNKNYVEVIISHSMPSIFGSIFNVSSLSIQARAVAGLAGAADFCVLSLAPLPATGIDIPGDLTTNGCSVAANGNIYVKDNISGTPEPLVEAAGTVDEGPLGSTYEGVPPVVNPLAYLTVPPENGCDYNGVFNVATTMTLFPGTYCGGIFITGNAVLSTGIYVIRGGGLSGGTISMVGNGGVTIINANGPGNDASAYRPFTFPQACNMSLSASTSGKYKGIVMMTDPAAPSTGPYSINDLCGKGDGDITGTIYFPTQTFNLGNGNGKLTITGQIIAAYITTTNGGGKLVMDGANAANVAAMRPSLVQ